MDFGSVRITFDSIHSSPFGIRLYRTRSSVWLPETCSTEKNAKDSYHFWNTLSLFSSASNVNAGAVLKPTPHEIRVSWWGECFQWKQHGQLKFIRDMKNYKVSTEYYCCNYVMREWEMYEVNILNLQLVH